jgi:hypothetical protein
MLPTRCIPLGPMAVERLVVEDGDVRLTPAFVHEPSQGLGRPVGAVSGRPGCTSIWRSISATCSALGLCPRLIPDLTGWLWTGLIERIS